jgi:glycosyltransferase involved in cell wall biosynthesis
MQNRAEEGLVQKKCAKKLLNYMNQLPKRILIFSLVYYPRYIGGAEVAVKEITDRINESDYIFDMITMDKTGPRKEKIGNVIVHRVGNVWLNRTKPFGKLYKYIFIFAAYRKAISLHSQNKYDAIWSIMANYAGFSGLFFKLKFPKIPFLLTLQEGDPIPYIKRRVMWVYPLFKLIFKKADKVQAISHYLARFAIEMGFKGLPLVIPNGVDLEHFSKPISHEERQDIRRKFGIGPEDVLLITASRLVKKNAVEDIIDALTFLPENYKLLILGTGILEKRLKARLLLNKQEGGQAKNSDLKTRVKFGGFVSHGELPAYLQASDIFIRPSLSEGLGNSFIEAMAAGIPVIATAVGGIPDFLFDGKTGLFCEVKNPKSIAEQVLKLKNEELRVHLITHAKDMVSGAYSWTQLSSQMCEFFKTP